MFFFIRHFYSQLVCQIDLAWGRGFYLWRLLPCSSSFFLDCPIFPTGYLLSQTLPSVYGKTDSHNANAKEMREFMMSMMDEAENELATRENMKLSLS